MTVTSCGELLRKFSCTQKLCNNTSPETVFDISRSAARGQVLNMSFARGKSNLRWQI